MNKKEFKIWKNRGFPPLKINKIKKNVKQNGKKINPDI